MPGQGLGGGQVAAGQADRAGLLPEHGDPRPSLLRRGPAALGDVGGDGQGGPPRQPLHLEPGLAPQFAQDERLGAGGLVLAERLERRRDELGLGLGEGAVGQQAADAGQPAAQRPGQAGQVPRRDRAHREGGGDLVDEVVAPPVGQVRPAAGQRQALRVLAGQRPQRAERPGGRPRLQRRQLAGDPDHRAGLRALVEPPRPGRGLQRGRERGRRGGGLPRAAVLERGEQLGQAPAGAGRLARPGVVARLPSHEPAPFDEHSIRS